MVDSVFEEPEYTTPETNRDQTDGSLSTNTLTLYVFGGIVAAGIFGVLVYLIITALTAEVTNDTTPVVAHIENASVHTVLVDETFTVAVLETESAAATLGTHEFVLVNADDVTLPAALVFELLTPDLPGSLRQHVNDVRFVSVDRSAPIIYISYTNKRALQGEMLGLESDLPALFAALYASANDSRFVDQQVAGTDVRVLTDELGRTYLTYGFTTENTLIIAGTLTDFATLVRN